MNRKLKALGLALFAALALSAVGAVAAQAAEFHSHEKETILTDVPGTFETQKFKAGTAKPIECNKLDIEGNNVGAETDKTTWTRTDITVGIDYTECEWEGNPATIDDDECHYKLLAETDVSEHADVELQKCKNDSITITVPAVGVTIHVPNQPVESAVHYVNTGETGNGRTVDVNATAPAVAFTCTPAFVCGLGGIPSSGNAEYTGKVEVGGYKYLGGTTGEYEMGEATTDIWWG